MRLYPRLCSNLWKAALLNTDFWACRCWMIAITELFVWGTNFEKSEHVTETNQSSESWSSSPLVTQLRHKPQFRVPAGPFHLECMFDRTLIRDDDAQLTYHDKVCSTQGHSSAAVGTEAQKMLSATGPPCFWAEKQLWEEKDQLKDGESRSKWFPWQNHRHHFEDLISV